VSETFGEGKTENVSIILSGYSSLILEIKSVPIPDPVPPPREWQTWKPDHRNSNKIENQIIGVHKLSQTHYGNLTKQLLDCTKNYIGMVSICIKTRNSKADHLHANRKGF
jgi:hypothetical protein